MAAHCIAGTPGAAFAADLVPAAGPTVISKATDAAAATRTPPLPAPTWIERLRRTGVRRVFVGGLATDYCVLNTVKDALALGYRAVVLLDAVRAVNVKPTDGEDALAQMRTLGAVTVSLEAIR